MIASTVLSRSSHSASARNPTWPRLMPSSGVVVSRVSSAARRIVPSPPITRASSQPPAASPSAGTTVAAEPAIGRSGASSSSSRTPISEAISRFATAVATSTASGRPVCVTSRTVRSAAVASWWSGWSGVCAVTASTFSPRTLRDDGPYRVLVDRVGAAAEPAEVLDVARRTRQRARADTEDAQPELVGGAGDVEDGLDPQLRLPHDATFAQSVLPDLELWLHHQHEVGVRVADVAQRRQHLGQG